VGQNGVPDSVRTFREQYLKNMVENLLKIMKLLSQMPNFATPAQLILKNCPSDPHS
jgi:hypothetical protein